jgi:hypothetical protein
VFLHGRLYSATFKAKLTFNGEDSRSEVGLALEEGVQQTGLYFTNSGLNLKEKIKCKYLNCLPKQLKFFLTIVDNTYLWTEPRQGAAQPYFKFDPKVLSTYYGQIGDQCYDF